MKAIAEEIKEVKLERDKLKLKLEEIMLIRHEEPLLLPPLEKIKTEIQNVEEERARKLKRNKLKLEEILKRKLPEKLEVVEANMQIRRDESLPFPPQDKIKTEIEPERASKLERDKLKLEVMLKTKLPENLEVSEEIMQIRDHLLFPPLEKIKTEIEVEFSTVS